MEAPKRCEFCGTTSKLHALICPERIDHARLKPSELRQLNSGYKAGLSGAAGMSVSISKADKYRYYRIGLLKGRQKWQESQENKNRKPG